jgi:hypothetical protein
MIKRWRLIILLIFPILLHAQSYSGEIGNVAAFDTAYFNVNISTLNPEVLSSANGLEWLSLSLTADETNKLVISLIGPDNTEIALANQCTWGTQFLNTYFKDDASTFINEGGGTYSDYYRPDENLGDENNGQSGNGLWKLKIINHNSGFVTLQSWSLHFSSTPSKPFVFESSNLPLILIQTNGQMIPDEPKITAQMQVVDNGAGVLNHLNDTPIYSSYIGIELRGSSSQSFLKKSYGLETRDAAGASVDA